MHQYLYTFPVLDLKLIFLDTLLCIIAGRKQVCKKTASVAMEISFNFLITRYINAKP